jgi:hypothetical protein
MDPIKAKRDLVVDAGPSIRGSMEVVRRFRGPSIESAVEGEAPWGPPQAASDDLPLSAAGLPKASGLASARGFRASASTGGSPQPGAGYSRDQLGRPARCDPVPQTVSAEHGNERGTPAREPALAIPVTAPGGAAAGSAGASIGGRRAPLANLRDYGTQGAPLVEARTYPKNHFTVDGEWVKLPKALDYWPRRTYEAARTPTGSSPTAYKTHARTIPADSALGMAFPSGDARS